MTRVTISGTVGAGPTAANRAEDVKAVQKLLNAHKSSAGKKALEITGRVTPELISRIEEFQKREMKMLRPDGRVDPRGKTLELLNGQQQASSNNMSLSVSALDLLKKIEQFRLTPYDDQTSKDISSWVKGATVGYGHLISQGDWDKYKDGLTKDQAEQLLKDDLKPFASAVNRLVKVKMTQQQFDALVILVFNIGETNFKDSSVLKLVNDANAKTSYSNLDAAWKAWNKSQGKVMKGLENRRAAELEIYHKGVYKMW